MEYENWRAATKAQRGKINPTGLAVVVAMHGAAIAALMFARPDLIPELPEIGAPPTVENIPTVIDIPPPPDPRAEDITETVTVPTQSDPRVPVDRTFTLPELPQTPIDTGEIVGPFTPPIADPTPPPPPPPPPDPVLTSARPHPGHIGAMQPRYPAQLRRSETEGSVRVRVRVEADGRVSEVQLIRTDHQAFFEATQRHALRRWRFEPATRDGTAVASWYETTVRFELM